MVQRRVGQLLYVPSTINHQPSTINNQQSSSSSSPSSSLLLISLSSSQHIYNTIGTRFSLLLLCLVLICVTHYNPRVQNFKMLFTSAHLSLISTYSLVQLLRALLYTNQIFNNTDHHGISYAFHSLS